jgi:hypothetical protein
MAAGGEILTALNEKQGKVSLQIEGIYDLVKEQKDFDEIIMRHFADPRGRWTGAHASLKTAEDCNISLSTRDEFQVSLPFLLTAGTESLFR